MSLHGLYSFANSTVTTDTFTRDCPPDCVRLKVAYCGICGTDLHEYLGGPVLCPPKNAQHPTTGATLPLTLGHEFSGTIIECGGDVSGLQLGQRVAVNPALDDRHLSKSDCDLCRTGRRNLCSSSAFYGLQHPSGGFADEVVISPFALVPLPDNISLKIAALAEPLAVAAHMIRVSGFQPGQNAVVLGAGPIGCALVLLLKDTGTAAKSIIVSEISPARRAMATASGADYVVDPSSSANAVTGIVRDVMGLGADIAFDAAGLQQTLDTAFAVTRPGGTIFNVAIHEKAKTLDLNLLTLPEKKLMAGNAYTGKDFERVIEVLATRGEEVEKFVTGVVPLEKAVEEGFEALAGVGGGGHNKILVQIGGEM